MNFYNRVVIQSYLINVFKKERPHKSVREFKDKLYQLSNDDLIRLADAIARFGLDNLIYGQSHLTRKTDENE